MLKVLFSGGVAHLLKALSNSDVKLVEAGVRALKMIFQVRLQEHFEGVKGDVCRVQLLQGM